MKHTTIKSTFLALILASMVPLAAACSDDDETPTSPTQPGPPVTTPAPEPAPAPAPTPTPTPTPPATVTVSGGVFNLARGGANDLDISFRIDDSTIVRAAAGTPVIAGSQTFNTDAVRNGQSVIAEGTRTNGFLDATRIMIVGQTP